jgi:hypothetical protein
MGFGQSPEPFSFFHTAKAAKYFSDRSSDLFRPKQRRKKSAASVTA